ncbi:MAG: c-type cytochrome biogenesis protein CcsB [Candidatus Sumerlaeia bacterium]|nr:c-type cytochrome biogenesis protein CcsB [Candidatus Sumerlaeia bacterium]
MNQTPMHPTLPHWMAGSLTVLLLLLALLLSLPLNKVNGETAGELSASDFPRLSDDPTSRFSTIPHNAAFEQELLAAGIDRITVRHLGWNETLRSWARIKIYDLTGSQKIRGQDPMYTVLSIMYEPQKWFDAAFLPIEHPRVAEILGSQGKWISPKFLADNVQTPELQRALSEARDRKAQLDSIVKNLNAAKQARQYDVNEPGLLETFLPEGLSLNEFRQLVMDEETLTQLETEYRTLRAEVSKDDAFLKAGDKLFRRFNMPSTWLQEFYIVPDVEDSNNRWLSAIDVVPGSMIGSSTLKDGVQLASNDLKVIPAQSAAERDVLRERNRMLSQAAIKLDAAFRESFASASAASMGPAVTNFLTVVEPIDLYPSQTYRNVKNFYIGFKPMDVSAMLYLLSAIAFGVFMFFRKNPIRWVALTLLLLGLGTHVMGGGIRLFLTGMMPVSNMYESITFTALCAVVIGVIFEFVKGRGAGFEGKGVFGLFTAIVGFLMLMGVAQMPLHETRIHPLRAVLNSYWLNIHVTAMLISYGAFMVATLFSISYLFKALLVKVLGRETLIAGTTPLMDAENTELFMYRLIQVGWPILTVGICLGAVWADTAWGRYWGWDPKETWAFITWLVYTMYLHSRMIMSYKGAISATIAFIGFVMVMITWLGVSYLPWFAGGLHTYASPL